MPRKKSVDSFKNLCLKNIAKNFDSEWFSPFEEQFGSSGRLIHVLGPFDHITSDLNRDLIHTLIEQKRLKVKHFQLLLTNRLTELDLREARPVANQDSIIETIAIRCQRLMKLNLDHFNRVSPKTFNVLLTSLTSLRHLSLQTTKINDSIIQCIGNSCPDLVELDLTGCKSITNRGIQSLMELNSNGDVAMFKTLMLLKIMFTNVTSSIIASVISLRKNLDVHYGKTFDVVHIAFRDKYVPGQEVLKSDQCAVKLLSTEEQVETLTIEKVNMGCVFCPNVTEVVLHGVISDELLLPLRCLEKLQKLDLACENSDQLTFETGVLPLLMDIGNKLLELNLHEINDVCLDSVAACCLNLRKLKCTILSATSVKLPPKIEEKVFCNLTHLDLQMESNSRHFPEYTLKNILINAKRIKDIKLMNMQSLTSELLLDVFKTNMMVSLCNLRLEFCDNLTADAIKELILFDNDLSECFLFHCKLITYSDFNNFFKCITKNRLDLTLHWK